MIKQIRLPLHGCPVLCGTPTALTGEIGVHSVPLVSYTQDVFVVPMHFFIMLNIKVLLETFNSGVPFIKFLLCALYIIGKLIQLRV